MTIFVDSSVWIARFRSEETRQTAILANALKTQAVLVGDVVLLELLQGARDERHAAQIERSLRQFEIVSLLDDEIAVLAASHYRRLRNKGITIRKTLDLIIGTYCIDRRLPLLHNDRDFEPMAVHLGLATV